MLWTDAAILPPSKSTQSTSEAKKAAGKKTLGTVLLLTHYRDVCYNTLICFLRQAKFCARSDFGKARPFGFQ
jgi:hypothetical protein